MKLDNETFLEFLIEEREIALAIGEVRGMQKMLERQIKRDLEILNNDR